MVCLQTESHSLVGSAGGEENGPRGRPVEVESLRRLSLMTTGGENWEELWQQVYADLHRLAEHWMRGQRKDHTLQASALINEAYIRIEERNGEVPKDRIGFLAYASTVMRNVLVDHARKRGRDKRTPPRERVALDSLVDAFESNAVDLVALDEALQRLSAFDPPMARAVELHFFGGLSNEEAADFLHVPLRSFERSWQATKAWLRGEIG